MRPDPTNYGCARGDVMPGEPCRPRCFYVRQEVVPKKPACTPCRNDRHSTCSYPARCICACHQEETK